MSKTPIHFIGFLINIDDSILRLKLGDHFLVEKLKQDEAKPFLGTINRFRSYHNASAINTSSEYYCIKKQHVTEFQETKQGGVVIKLAESHKIKHEIRNKVRLLRLFKEGNIILHSLCLYYMKEATPRIISSIDEWPIIDRTIFRLTDNEISQAESFVQEIELPFSQPFLQLAFDSFELSYETANLGLAFLSLMISLEAMLNVDRGELRYRVSRNAAVLLGETQEKSKHIFKEIREFYDKRSELVHTGNFRCIDCTNVLKLRDYVRKTIREIHRIGCGKEYLERVLTENGFGCRPWIKNN